MGRYASTFLFAAFVGVVACGAYDLSPLTSGTCPEGQKACEVKGVLSCVPKTDAKTGCARDSCLPCNLLNVETTVCAADGECAIGACKADFSDCDPNKPGCETEVAFDPKNCNTCGFACPTPPNATAVCNRRVCGVGSCATNFDNCDGDPNNGCETNLLTSATHCGKCNNPCEGGVCTNGKCP